MNSAFEEPFDFGGQKNRVTFGKYKGCDIQDVPTDYIEWFVCAGTPGTARYQMFEEELKRRSEIPSTPIGGDTQAETKDTQPKEEQPEKPASEELMVFSKEKIEELAISTYTRGYNAAYARLFLNIRAIPWVKTFYMDRFKAELLASLQEDRKIDPTKFEDPAANKTAMNTTDHKNNDGDKKRWTSMDHRKSG